MVVRAARRTASDAGRCDSTATCPALFLCAPASGQGKTTITAGLARYHREQGRRVHVFKTGPDYLDPMILHQASGRAVAPLDLWMVGAAACQQRLAAAARVADLILVEGAMGLFDGQPSGADLAELFGLPVAVIIDAAKMAQTFGALASGLVRHRPQLSIVGVIANNLASARHHQLIADSMPPDIPFLGGVAREVDYALPERHLGLVQPHEVTDLEPRLQQLAVRVEEAGLTALPPRVSFSGAVAETAVMTMTEPAEPIPPLLAGQRIGIAQDTAFTFIYADNLLILEQMGAQFVYFSPLHDHTLPRVDALWLPGGYPELHHAALAANTAMHAEIIAFHRRGQKILAECGGMLYLMQTLTDLHGHRSSMVGLLPGDGVMRQRGGCQGMQYAPFPTGEVRAHAHHRARCDNTATPIAHGRRPHHPAPGEPIYQQGGLTASYLHLYFPSNPAVIAGLLSG